MYQDKPAIMVDIGIYQYILRQTWYVLEYIGMYEKKSKWYMCMTLGFEPEHIMHSNQLP